MPPPCEIEVLDDGTCQFGMPAILPENRRAIELYADFKILGWEATAALHNLELTDYERGELLMKFRVLAGEAAAIEREQMKASAKGAGRG